MVGLGTPKAASVTLDPKQLGLLRTSLAATGGALIVVAGIYVVAQIAGDDLLVAPEVGSGAAEELKLVAALAATVIGGAVGCLLAAAARRLTPNPRASFLIACAIGLTTYGILAFARADQTSSAIWLNTMHIGAAAPIVGALTLLLAPPKRHKHR